MPSPYPYLAHTRGNAIARINYLIAGGRGHAQIEWAYRSEGTLGLDFVADANVIGSEFNNWLSPYLSSESFLHDIQITGNDGTKIVNASSTFSPYVGTGPSNQVAPAVCWVLRKGTGLLGKANRGRCYMPGLPGSLLSDPGSLTQANVNTMNIALAGMLAALITAELNPFLIRKTSNPVLFNEVPVTTLFTEPLLATQSRRQRKVAHR